MNTVAVVDASGLPTLAFKSRSPIWWAAICLMCIEGTGFLIAVASYYYVRLGYSEWPPPGHNMPGLLLPTINLALLLVSCYPAWVASEGAVKMDAGAIKRGLWINEIMAVAALAIRVVDWHGFLFDWRAGIYGSLIWLLFGLHTFEMIAGVLMTAVLIVLVHLGRLGEKQRAGIDFDSLVWYFLVGIWVPMYFTIYIAPYVL